MTQEKEKKKKKARASQEGERGTKQNVYEITHSRRTRSRGDLEDRFLAMIEPLRALNSTSFSLYSSSGLVEN
jgi:hypothetical protein